MAIRIFDDNPQFPLFVNADEQDLYLTRQSHFGADEIVIPMASVPDLIDALQCLQRARSATKAA